MKTNLILFISLSFSCFSGDLISENGWASKEAHSIITQIESSGGKFLVGDGGKAIGAYQIQPIMVKEINRIYGTKFTLQDRKCHQKSARIFELWIYFASKNHNGKTDAEVLSTWNTGLRHKTNSKYVKKIERLRK